MRTYRSLPALAKRREALARRRLELEVEVARIQLEERALEAQAEALFQRPNQAPQLVLPSGAKLTYTTAAIGTLQDWPKLLAAVGKHAKDEAWQSVVHRRVSPTAVEALLQQKIAVPGYVLDHKRVVRFSLPHKKKET